MENRIEDHYRKANISNKYASEYYIEGNNPSNENAFKPQNQDRGSNNYKHSDQNKKSHLNDYKDFLTNTTNNAM